MRFTEHEMTAAMTGVAKQAVAAGRGPGRGGLRGLLRRGATDPDEAWEALTRFQRYTVLDGLGSEILPVLVALPDVEVEPGTAPTFTDEQVTEAVEQTLSDDLSGVRRATALASRLSLVRLALTHLPPRQDPDALIVPDHL